MPAALAALALALFVALGWAQAGAFMVWSEETMVYPAPAPTLLAPDLRDGAAHTIEACQTGRAATVWLPERPRWSACAGGRVWPVMLAPYFSGLFYWPSALLAPLHRDDVFALRRLGLLFGAASLALTALLAARLSSRETGACVALALATGPCFVALHATLVQFETVPWALLVGATLLALKRGPRASARRGVAAALLLGLSLLANFKTLFLAGPTLLALARLRRLDLPRGRGARAAMAVAAVAPLAPMIAGVALAPDDGAGDRSANWSENLARHVTHPERLAGAAVDATRWWSNMADYLSSVTGPAPFNVVSFTVAAAVFVFTVVDGARTLRRREGDAVIAVAASCLVAYAVMVALLYDSYPANFAPLHSVFGLALGGAAARLSRRAGRAWPLVALALCAPFAWNTAQTIASSASSRAYLNVSTERAAVAHLLRAPSRGAVNVTVDNMFGGVVDSLSRGRVRTVQASALFSACERRGAEPGCAEARGRALLRWAGRRPVRLVIAESEANGFHPTGGVTGPSLASIARSLGYAVSVEARFPTPAGGPGLAVYRFDPPSAAP